MSKLDYPKRSAALFKPAPADTNTQSAVFLCPGIPLATKPKVLATKSKHGTYANAEKRAAYMRDLMRKKRAG